MKHFFLLNFVSIIEGGKQFIARGLYSSKTENKSVAFYMINCNGVPQINFEDEAMKTRTLLIPWESKFVSKEDEVDEQNHTYLINPDFNSVEFRQKYGSQLVHILMDHLQENFEK